MTTPFEEAAAAVAGGADARAEAAALVEAMTPEERRWCLDGDLPFWAGLGDLGTGGYHKRPFPAAVVERLGVPGFRFSDGPRGIVIGPATAFPVSMGRGATWDLDLEERIGDAIGRELRAVGADLYGGVCVNVLRHPAWGRAQETYGEDPFHVGELGAALTRGVQRHAMACVKHLACNSMENARFKVDVTVDEVALHEVFLPHFRRIVDEGVASVMSAYNSVNGEWCGQSHALLRDVLRGEWGFDGFVISDWIFGLRAAGPSVTAGLDVEMPYRMVRSTGLDAAVEAGEVTEEDIAERVVPTVATLLRFAERLAAPRPGTEVLACPEHRALAREAATRAIVLLRNEAVDGRPLLPLDAGELRRVAVVGRLAALRNLGDHGSSDVWAPEVVTPVDGLRAALPDAEVVHHEEADGVAGADVAVVVVGYTAADEGEYIGQSGTSHLSSLFPGPDDPELAERFTAAAADDPWPPPPEGVGRQGGGVGFGDGGDRVSLRLHEQDEALVRAVAAANPRTVVAVVSGSAVLLSPWIGSVPAVVQAWYGGMEGGAALADVLLGVASPTGRLPFTVPTDEAHLPPFDREADQVTYDAWHGWWRLERDGHEPAFPFGFGLTYTDFALGAWSLERVEDELLLRGTVANTGARDGTDVVQAYGGRQGDRRRLVGFARVDVAAGHESAVELRVPLERLAARDPAGRGWVVPPGRYELRVARHATDPGSGALSVDLP
ncbi:MAG: beta-glucosidase-like glycosyl hydrolase [Acidimicrobiales bacterium]|nr:beta-glucosidase-like glycosyl hydrolase [Acidimicrobiales bacterium]